METLTRQALLTAALEALGELRAEALLNPHKPIDVGAYSAAITVAASAVSDGDRADIASLVPAKAALDAADLDQLVLFVAELLRDVAGGKAAATKAVVHDMAALTRSHYAASAENLRWAIQSERNAEARAAESESDAAWVARWLRYGQLRAALVRKVAAQPLAARPTRKMAAHGLVR